MGRRTADAPVILRTDEISGFPAVQKETLIYSNQHESILPAVLFLRDFPAPPLRRGINLRFLKTENKPGTDRLKKEENSRFQNLRNGVKKQMSRAGEKTGVFCFDTIKTGKIIHNLYTVRKVLKNKGLRI